jgi:hypothetical protein
MKIVPLYYYLEEITGEPVNTLQVMVGADGSLHTNYAEPWFGPLEFHMNEEAELAALESRALELGQDPEQAW